MKRLTARQRKSALLLVPLAVCAWLVPGIASAGSCGDTIPDVGACVDAAQYNVWQGLTGFGWSLDQLLLQLAYQLDALRWWLITTAFQGAYDVLTRAVNPLIVPLATLALIFGCLAFALMPLVGRNTTINVRQIVIWIVLAPTLLTASGPLLVQVEQARSDFASALFSGAAANAPGALFGAAGAGDMAAPQPLYPSNPCGGAGFQRYGVANAVRVDELAAALLWANAQDIHCAERAGPSRDLPDAFFVAEPEGPGYAYSGDIGQEREASARSTAVLNIQRGAYRVFLALLPCGMAALYAFVQLMFSLCLVVLWVGLPIGLLFVFFQQTSEGIISLFRKAAGVFKVSWTCSFVLGIIVACLQAAATLKNATAYIGFSIGALVLTAYFLFIAWGTLAESVRALSATVASGTGMQLTQPFEMAQTMGMGAVSLGAAAMTGGAALGLAATAGYQQTGSRRYAAAAMLGRFNTLSQVGEIAAALGYNDQEVTQGLHAGQRSHQGLRSMRLAMEGDRERTDANGRTIRDAVQERRLARSLSRQQHPSLREELGDVAQAGVNVARKGIRGAQAGAAHAQRGWQASKAAIAYVADGQMMNDLKHAADPTRLTTALGDGWQQMQQAGEQFGQEVHTRSNNPTNPVRSSTAAAQIIAERVAQRANEHSNDDRRHAAMRLNPQRQIETLPRVGTEALPASVRNETGHTLNIPRLLTLGYTVQANADATVSFWRDDEDNAPGAEEERLRLIRAGALRGSAAEQARARTLKPAARQVTSSPAEASSGVARSRSAAPRQRTTSTPPAPTAPVTQASDGGAIRTPDPRWTQRPSGLWVLRKDS